VGFWGLAHGFIKGTLSIITLHVLNFVQGNSKMHFTFASNYIIFNTWDVIELDPTTTT
jgi:hypothetical protein